METAVRGLTDQQHRVTRQHHQSDIRMLECWNSRNAMLRSHSLCPLLFHNRLQSAIQPSAHAFSETWVLSWLHTNLLYISLENMDYWDENETQIFLTLTSFLLDFRNIFGFESAFNFTDCSYAMNLQFCFLFLCFYSIVHIR
jgi:hypothetical protein